MRKDKPSRTALKVAFNIVTLGSKPGMNFFEVDHPATAHLKARGIESMRRRKNLRLVAEDLGKRKLSDVLKTDKSWDLSAQTIIIAEGLGMYLSPEAVRDLFCQCAAFVGGGSRIAFSYIPAGADGRPDAGRWTGLIRISLSSGLKKLLLSLTWLMIII